MAGPEIAVATTKAFSTQLIAAYVLAIQMGYVKGKVNETLYQELIEEIKTIPDKVQYELDHLTNKIQK